MSRWKGLYRVFRITHDCPPFPGLGEETCLPFRNEPEDSRPESTARSNPLCLAAGTQGYVPSGYSLGRLVLGTGGWQKVRWWAGREGVGGRRKPCLDTHEALAEVAPSSCTVPAGTVQGARCMEANQEVGLCARGAGGSSSWRTPNSKFTAVTRTRGLRRKVCVCMCVGGSFLLIAPSFPLGLVDSLRTLSPPWQFGGAGPKRESPESGPPRFFHMEGGRIVIPS